MTTYNEEFNQYRVFLENIARSVTPQDSEVLIKPQHLRNRAVCHSDAEGEVIYWILKFLEEKKCPTKLVAPIVRNVLTEIQNDPRYKDPNTEAYFDLRSLATTVLEGFCIRLLDNVELNKILDTATLHSAQQELNDDLLSIPIRAAGASQNKRRRMEDRSICIDEFHKVYDVKDAQKASFYGIFDGHIGYLAAQYAASQLPYNFSLDAFASTNPIDAFYRTFKHTDERFISKGVPSGTTAVCVLYRPEESRLYVAWVGDSKAMLAKQHGKLMQLVKPHRPEIEKERDRIQALGGSIHFVQGAYRVNGSLNVTRSIGDSVHKTFLVSHPDCVVVEMDKQEEFLVIATDGLWDHVNEADVARIVYESITEDWENLDQIPSRLIKLAQDGNSTDNISVVVLFFKHPSQIAKNCDNLNIMDSEFDNIKEVDYYNSKNFYPSEENTTSNSHPIDAKQLRWSPNDNLNNIINEEVKQTTTTTAGTTTSANNGQFDDNLLYSSDDIDTNLKNPPPVEDDNNSHHVPTLGNLAEEFSIAGLDNKIDLTNTGFDNDQQKILEKNQLQQQLVDTDADYGPETCVDVTDDVVMMTENSADTNNLLEQSTLSHSKDTLPSSDNCNPFDNKNALDLEDGNEFHLGGIGADTHLQLDDANKSTPLLSPEVEDLPLSSEGGLQYTNEGFQQSPLNDEAPVEIGSHQQENEFEDEFVQRNGHFSPIDGKDDEHEKEHAIQTVEQELKQLIDNDIPSQEADLNKDIQDYLTDVSCAIQHENEICADHFENNDNDEDDFRSKDEEEMLEKHTEVGFADKGLTDLDNDVLNLNQRNELQQTRQYLEDDIFEEKPILTGYLAESPLSESNVDEFTKQPEAEKPTDFVEEKQNKEEFTEKEIELEDECIHLEEDVRPSEYLSMLARQTEEQQQLTKVDTEFVRQLTEDVDEEELKHAAVQEEPLTKVDEVEQTQNEEEQQQTRHEEVQQQSRHEDQHQLQHEDQHQLQHEDQQQQTQDEDQQQHDDEQKQMPVEQEQPTLRKVDEGFVRQETLDVDEVPAEIELEALGIIDEGIAHEDALDDKHTEIESEPQHLPKLDEGFVGEYPLDDEQPLPNGEQQTLKKDDFGSLEMLEEDRVHIDTEPQPLRKIDEGFVRENTLDEEESILNGEQLLRQVEEDFVKDEKLEEEKVLVEDQPQPLQQVDDGYIKDYASDDDQAQIEGNKPEHLEQEQPSAKVEEFNEDISPGNVDILPEHDDKDDRLSDKVEQFSKEQERLNEKEELNEEEQLDLEEKQTEQAEELPKDSQHAQLSETPLIDDIQQEIDTNKLSTDDQISPLGEDSAAQPEKQCFEEPEKKVDDALPVQDIDHEVTEHEQIGNDELPIEEDENKLEEPVEETEKQHIEITEKYLSKIEQQILDFDPAPAVKKQVQPLLQTFVEDPDNLVEVEEELIVKEQVKPKPDVLPAVPQEPLVVPPTHESCDESEDEEWKYMKEGQGEKQLLGLQEDTVLEEESHPESPQQQQPPLTPVKLDEQVSSVVSEKIETIRDSFENLTQNIAELAERAASPIAEPMPTVEKVGDALENLNLSQSSTREKLDNLEDENISASEMNSRLNPDAKEFVPSFSPTAAIDLSNGFNVETPPTAIPQHFKDELLAQSPRKGRESNMEHICLPAENEFDEEIANKPHELDTTTVEHAENGLYQEMNWKEAMHGSEKEEGPLVDSPATEDNIGTDIDSALHYEAAPNLCEFTAPIGLDNAGMKDSIYVENNTEPQQSSETDVLNTVQVLPAVEDAESKDNSFEMLNASKSEDITPPPAEQDAVTKEEVQQILTLAGDEKQAGDEEELKQMFEDLLMSHDKEITKDVKNETEQVPVDDAVPEASDLKLIEPSPKSETEHKPAVPASDLAMQAAAAAAVIAVAATTATKKREAEKNQKNLLKTSAAPKSKVPDTKKSATGTTTKTVSSVAAKRTVAAERPKAPISSSITKKPISSTAAAARPRTAPAAGSKTPTEKKPAATAGTMKSRVDTKPPSTSTARKPLTSSIGKAAANKIADESKANSGAVKSTTGSKSSITSGKTITNAISKPRPTTASAATTNGSATKTTTAPKPISLAAKNATVGTKSSLTSPRGTLTSTLRKTEALKILVIPNGNAYTLLPISDCSNEVKKTKHVEPECLFCFPKKGISKTSQLKSPTKTTTTVTARASSTTNGTKTTTATRTTTIKASSSTTSTVPTAAARTTTTTTTHRRTITGAPSTVGAGATTPTSKTNHLVPRKSTPLKKTTTNSSSTTPTARKNLNTSVSKTTKDTSTPRPIKGHAPRKQNSIISAEQPKDLLQGVPDVTSTLPADNGEPKLNGIASPDDVSSPTAPLIHPLEAEVA